jgi:CheY-like chemotaxis protein/signal transduction histidine kinase/CHASE3 domain sensor protein
MHDDRRRATKWARFQREGWFADLNIQTKFWLAFGLVLGLFAITCVGFFSAVREVREVRQHTRLAFATVINIEDVSGSVLDQETGLRGFLLAGRSEYLLPYEQGLKQFEQEVRDLEARLEGKPMQLIRLQRIRDLMMDWRRNFADRVLVLHASPATRDEATTLLESGEGKRRIDEIRRILETLIAIEEDDLQVLEDHLEKTLERIQWLTLLMLVLGLGVGALALRLTATLITAPIRSLTDATARITRGERDVQIGFRGRRDEIGSIARALEIFREANAEVRKREWVKTRVATLAEIISAQSEWADFGNRMLAELCPAVGAGHGTLFRIDAMRDCLVPVGAYAVDSRLVTTRALARGEGLVGQCWASGRPLILRDIPADYLRIGSGLGEAAPAMVGLWPLHMPDGVVGVLELATFQPFDAAQSELIEETLKIAALAMDSLGNAIRTRSLLEQTREQAQALRESQEELRAQQEELRASNDALTEQAAQLEEQSEKLRASEEELRVQAEELRQTNDELNERRQALEHAGEILERKNAEVEQASRYKSEFLANMSHELRTPLNALLILAKGLADNDSGHLDAEEIESAQIIHESGHNLLKLINDILDLAKVESGKMEAFRETVAPAELLTQMRRNFGHVARERKLDFEVSLDPEVPATILTDSGKTAQILTNLLGNAFKFTETGGVHLDVSADETYVHFAVRDSGIGIAEDKIDRVFRAFEQADGSTSRRYGGTGLGLPICKGLAELLGGDIRARSTLGEGSVFTLSLPIDAGAARPGAGPAGAPTPVISRRVEPSTAPEPVADDRDSIVAGDTVILVIEDDLNFARIVVNIARRKHYRVLHATSGESGVRMAREHLPTGIILDVGLPDIDGYEVLSRLKSDAATRHIPVHFITAGDDASRALEAGAAGFMTKPVTQEDVVSSFERVLHFADGKPRKLLVVEDDNATRVAVRSLLGHRSEIEIIEVDTGAAALDALEGEHGIDCMILDLGLPDMSGFEVLDRLSRRGEVPPVVIYSARELTADDDLRLREYTDSIVIKGARSPERLLDEVSLFLHAIRNPAGVRASTRVTRELKGRRVLLVDDDVRNIFALSKALRAHGLDVLMAQDGHKALAQLDANTDIELVLMDIMMPGMDGYTAMREIRKQSRWRDLPIIAVTAKAMRGDREKCIEAGASDYLSKPVDVDKLISMMRVWLDA